MRHPLPFAGFLEVLRARGVPIGLREHQALARLLAHWGETDRLLLRDALAALLARGPAEVAHIRELFDEHYPPLPPLAPPPRRRRPLLAYLAGLLVLCGVVALSTKILSTGRPEKMEREEESALPPIGQTSNVASTSAPAACPAPPELPAAPLVGNYAILVLFILGGATLAFSVLYWTRRRRVRRAWLRAHWRDILDALPGPHQYGLTLRCLPPSLRKEDLEDMATILGRTPLEPAEGRELDVERTIMRLVQAVGKPLVFQSVRRMRPLLLFEDRGPEMNPWTLKTEALFTGLWHRGVQVERWFFTQDLSLVSRVPRGPLVSLAELLRQHGDSPVLIISTGAGIFDPERGVAPWVKNLEDLRYVAWLHPLESSRLRHPTFKMLPLRVWPFTRVGMLGAAYDLAQEEKHRMYIPPERLRVVREVSEADVAQLKQVLALVPRTTPGLIQMFRQRYCANVPEDAMALLTFGSLGYGGMTPYWSPEERGRLLAELHSRSPGLEIQVRRDFLDVLSDSEPPIASAAHLRWRLDVALQRFQLPDPSERERGVVDIRALAEGPIWEEVEQAIRELRHVRSDLTPLPPIRELEPGRPPPAAGVPQPLLPPSAREYVATLLVAILIASLGMMSGRFVYHLPHNDRFYTLEWVDNQLKERQQAGYLLVRLLAPEAPRQVELVRDGIVVGQYSLHGEATQGTRIYLRDDEREHYYQVRSRLAQGNLGLSEPRWLWISPMPLETPLPSEANVQARGELADAGTQPDTSVPCSGSGCTNASLAPPAAAMQPIETLWRDGTVRGWQGMYRQNTSGRQIWSFELRLRRSQEKIEGAFRWWAQELSSGSGSVLGDNGHEWVHGTIDRTSHLLHLQGYRVDSATLLLDEYLLRLEENGSLKGTNRSVENNWAGRISAQPRQDISESLGSPAPATARATVMSMFVSEKQCLPEQVQVDSLGEERFHVSGCGEAAEYVCGLRSRSSCRLMNRSVPTDMGPSPVDAAAPAAPERPGANNR